LQFTACSPVPKSGIWKARKGLKQGTGYHPPPGEHPRHHSSSPWRDTLYDKRFVLALLAAIFLARPAGAQELEPRAYAPSPVGANFLLLNYSYQSGEILFDPALPFSDVNAYINGVSAAYGHTFPLFGRFASAAIAVPYAFGSINGNVGEDYQRITRSGLGDLRARFVVNLIGGSALTMKEFRAHKPETTLGFSLVVAAPTGQYSPEKLINIGQNRWAFRPEFGLSYPTGPWTLEAAAGVWLFTDNTQTYPGTNVRSQAPLFTFQAHGGYTFKPGLWLALDATFYGGGRTSTNGVPGDTRVSNSRVGATFSLPVARGHSIKFLAATGVSARVGSRFDTYGIAYQFLWLD